MKIGSTDDISSYLTKLYQQTQGTSNSSAAYTNNSLFGSLSCSDTVDISEDAYNSLASGNASTIKPPPPPPPQMDGADEALQNLVDEGTITSDQASAIKDAIISAADGAGSSVSSDLSEQPEDSSVNPLKTLLENLVSEGFLSEDQAASVADALKPPPPPQDMAISDLEAILTSSAITDSSGEETV